MFTKEQLLQIMPDLPNEFSMEDLLAILNRPRPEPPVAEAVPTRPTNLTPEEAADWDYYTSPKALALYAKFPVSPEVDKLRGIATCRQQTCRNQLKSGKALEIP